VVQQTSIGGNVTPSFLAGLTLRMLGGDPGRSAWSDSGGGGGGGGSGGGGNALETGRGGGLQRGTAGADVTEMRTRVLPGTTTDAPNDAAADADPDAFATATAATAAATADTAVVAAAQRRLVEATARLGALGSLKVLWSSARAVRASLYGSASFFTPEAFDAMGTDGQVGDEGSSYHLHG
jgi:hypothetical protein